MIKDRQGQVVRELEGQNQLLKKLYSTSIGRCALKILVSPFVTHLGGLYMSSPFSKTSISSFIKNNDIENALMFLTKNNLCEIVRCPRRATVVILHNMFYELSNDKEWQSIINKS